MFLNIFSVFSQGWSCTHVITNRFEKSVEFFSGDLSCLWLVLSDLCPGLWEVFVGKGVVIIVGEDAGSVKDTLGSLESMLLRDPVMGTSLNSIRVNNDVGHGVVWKWISLSLKLKEVMMLFQ